ncbi:MAG: tetratricopeptide repeat protein, partial [Flavobacteriales bacterium]|nr:tetratricopeptide repeat protein [Flavobacteriales bacterium]
DCYYVNKDFYNALEYYDKAISVAAADMDYALYQKAMVQGVLSKYGEKVKTLESLLASHSKSGYRAAATYELANAYGTMNRPEDALKEYARVEKDYPQSVYVKDAIMKRGLIFLQSGKSEEARASFEKVAVEHMGTDAAREALNALKEYYVERGQVDAYFEWVKNKLPGTSIELTAQDSITYEAAYLRYMKSDCSGAMKDFENYLGRFPDGIFSVQAHFYKSECEYFIEAYDKALKGYEYVISKPKNTYTEQSLQAAANIHMIKIEYGPALKYWKALDQIAEMQSTKQAAMVGQLRCYASLSGHEEVLELARRILELSKVDKALEVEIHLLWGESALGLNRSDEAMEQFEWVFKHSKGQMAARAQYRKASILHSRQEYKASEEAIFTLIDELTSYDEWVAKALLLLAENYYQQGDLFQAKYTLKSLVEDARVESVKKQARERLAIIEAEEKANQRVRERDTLEIELDRNPVPDRTQKEEDHE